MDLAGGGIFGTYRRLGGGGRGLCCAGRARPARRAAVFRRADNHLRRDPFGPGIHRRHDSGAHPPHVPGAGPAKLANRRKNFIAAAAGGGRAGPVAGHGFLAGHG